MLEVAELPELVERYAVWLERQPLSERTRREYARQVAGFVEWLAADPARGADALADPFARDYAVRDFKRHLKLERRWSPASVNLALAAVDHFLRFVGLGAAEVSRERLPQAAPRALEGDELLAFVRAAERAAARDRAIGLLLVYAGLRLSELVALDLDDARVSGRKAVVVIRSGKGDVYREVPLNAPARKALDEWLKKRPAPAARIGGEPLFVSRAGGRLSARSVDDVVRKLGRAAGVELSAHVLRHTWVTKLVRAGNDVVLVADLAGHRKLETTRRYSLPSLGDRQRAVDGLAVDQ
jgi:site-specific recombinase XerC